MGNNLSFTFIAKNGKKITIGWIIPEGFFKRQSNYYRATLENKKAIISKYKKIYWLVRKIRLRDALTRETK